MRTRLALLAFPLLASSLFAACDGGSSNDATYSKATPKQRLAAVGAARGDLATGSMLAGAVLAALPNSPACPTITRSGKDVTIKGGCSAGDARIDGSLTIKGLDLAAKPTDKPVDGIVSFDWNKFAVTSAGKKVSIDGSITVETKAGKGTLQTDLTVEADGERVEVDSGSTCVDKKCTVDAESSVTIKGVGTGEIKGDFAQTDTGWAGALELHGDEVLRVDFAKVKTPGCYEATVAGKAVDAICLDVPKAPKKGAAFAAIDALDAVSHGTR